MTLDKHHQLEIKGITRHFKVKRGLQLFIDSKQLEDGEKNFGEKKKWVQETLSRRTIRP